MNKLSGKVAVVTGASKGIGASIAEHLAAEGASVVVNYSSSTLELRALTVNGVRYPVATEAGKPAPAVSDSTRMPPSGSVAVRQQPRSSQEATAFMCLLEPWSCFRSRIQFG